jgi:hypothetical protein
MTMDSDLYTKIIYVVFYFFSVIASNILGVIWGSEHAAKKILDGIKKAVIEYDKKMNGQTTKDGESKCD